MAYQSINPYNGKILKTFEEFTDQQLDTALQTAAKCFETWRHTTFAERARIVAKVAALMNAMVDELARFVTLEMGKRIDRPGSFMEPTILTDIAPQNPAFRQEFFGPVTLFFRVKDEDEAVALANDSDFGLVRVGTLWQPGLLFQRK